MIKICEHCGEIFETLRGNQKYCSDSCKKKEKWIHEKLRRQRNPQKIREYRHNYYLRHKAERKAYNRQYYLDHPDKFKIYSQRQYQKMKIQRCSKKHDDCFSCPTKNGECLYD